MTAVYIEGLVNLYRQLNSSSGPLCEVRFLASTLKMKLNRRNFFKVNKDTARIFKKNYAIFKGDSAKFEYELCEI